MTKEEAMEILDDMSDYFLVMGRTLDGSGQRDHAEMNFKKYNAVRIALDAMRNAENSPSDARKGEGWSTISVDENVGSNAAISAADAIVKMGEAFDLFAKATADMLRNKE